MSIPHIAVIPVGRLELAELEMALSRVAKGLRRPVELRGALPVPQGVEDTGRRQFRVATLLSRLKTRIPQLGPGTMVGVEEGEATKAPPTADAHVFVTDVDLFTAKSDGVFAALSSLNRLAIVSVRRLREPFYRRTSDPAKQRARLVKEILRMAGRLAGSKECADSGCVLAPSRSVTDLDLKEEGFCRSCAQRLFEGTIRI